MVKKIQSDRRSFLSKLWLALGLVAVAEFVAGGITFFISGRKERKQPSNLQMIAAGDINDFLPGTVTFIQAGNCYLSRLTDGGILAISRKCTHLGCAVPWVVERNQFECPCHASVFDNTGKVTKSPASRALDLFPVSFKQDRIMIDITHPLKRTSFAADQLAYPQELG